jgi:hypothetical protein
MKDPYEEKELFIEERSKIHELLAENPNYFGTAPETDFPVEQPIEFNTSYEGLTCVGLWPEKNLLEATILVKLPFGFLGEMCTPGSYEYVRFFIDWDNDGDFDDPQEDLGVARVNVHDIPQVEKHPLCYAVRQTFLPLPADCKKPYIVRLRAILSWEVEPPPGDWNFVPIWGNMLECWVQIDPTNGQVVGVVPEDQPYEEEKPEEIEMERLHFLDMLAKNPNYFGTQPEAEAKPEFPMKYNTSYEELGCIGLYPERDFLEAILQVKLPYGFLSGLCGPGSYEYVRFYIDWDGDGDFYDANEDAGVATVNLHDIPYAAEVPLCYALGKHFLALRASCEKPYIVKVRAILSWQQMPTGPDFIPVWGNVVECYVQINPTEPEPEETLVALITDPADTSPPQCVHIGPTPACELAGVTITGQAFGTGFTSYRVEYRPVSDLTWRQTGVVYPDCSLASATPDHATPRFSEPLGFLTNLEPDEYEVMLRVDGAGGPIYASTTFSMHRSPVVIDEIGAVPARDVGTHPDDATELLKLIKEDGDAADPETSVGGSISVGGSADFYGCGRQMIEYIVQYQEAPFGTNPPQADAAAGWIDINQALPYGDPDHPRGYYCWPHDRYNYVINGKLTRVWRTIRCRRTGWPLPTTYHDQRRTEESDWITRTKSTALNGRFTVRLRLKHQDILGLGPVEELYDAATVWLDNRDILAQITGLAIAGVGDLQACAEVYLSQFVGTTLEIKGRAWDPLILDTVPTTEVPNDNFDHYWVRWKKDGGVGYLPDDIFIPDPHARVPNDLPALRPPPDDVGVLATWDIVTSLDAGVAPPVPYVDPSPRLYRGEHCAYVIKLYARDKTRLSDTGHTHDREFEWPLCVVNDL